VSEEGLPLSITRYMYAELLPGAEIEALPIVSGRVDRQQLRRRESGHDHGEIHARQKAEWRCDGRRKKPCSSR